MSDDFQKFFDRIVFIKMLDDGLWIDDVVDDLLDSDSVIVMHQNSNGVWEQTSRRQFPNRMDMMYSTGRAACQTKPRAKKFSCKCGEQDPKKFRDTEPYRCKVCRRSYNRQRKQEFR